MTSNEQIEQKLQNLSRAIGSDELLVEKIMGRIAAIPPGKPRKSTFRRFTMNRLTKLAAAAAIIIAVVLSINFLNNSIPSAYAIEQTIEASHSVRYLHIKSFDLLHEDEPKQFWFECDEFGQIKNARWHMPEWDSPADGAKVVVWKDGKASVWFKKKNSFLIVRDRRFIRQMLALLQAYDPRNVVERFRIQETEGKVKIEILEPADKADPIIVTATYLFESPSPGRREVLFVDQATKLVTAIEHHQLKDNEYKQISLMEFYDYNIPIDPEMFDLDNELPADVIRVDQTTQEVGLVQGDLTDEEIASEVARQFFEALIAKDYAKAGKLLVGMPAKNVQQMFGKFNCIRIISIGSVAPHPNPRTKGLIVPCIVEIEKDGQISEWKLDRLGVRQVYNQPGRWTIFGGI